MLEESVISSLEKKAQLIERVEEESLEFRRGLKEAMLERGVNEDVVDGFLKQGEEEFKNIMKGQVEKNAGAASAVLEALSAGAKGIKNIGGSVGDAWRTAGEGEGMWKGIKNIFHGEPSVAGAPHTPPPAAASTSTVPPASTPPHTPPPTSTVPPASTPPHTPPPTSTVPPAAPAAASTAPTGGASTPGFGENFMRGMTFRSRQPGGGLSGFLGNRLGKATSAGMIGTTMLGPVGGAAGVAAGLLGRGGILGLGALGAGGAMLGTSNMLGGGGGGKYGLPAYKQDRLIPGVSNEMLGTGAGAIGALMLSKELDLPVGSVLPLLLGGYLGHKFLPGAMSGGNPLSQYGYSRSAMPTQF
jgi:hypothetical protein